MGLRRGQVGGARLELPLSGGTLFELLNLHLRLRQLGLANLDQLHALLVPLDQRFQRQILGLHRVHDGFEFLQGFLERQRSLGAGRTGGFW